MHLTRRNGRPSKACAPILEAILGDSSIVKAGTGIDQDMVELWECWRGLQARSRLDIGGIGSSRGSTTGLQRLTTSILGVNLKKSKKQAVSDWSQVPLTDAQLSYSARDAWAGAAIVAELAAVSPEIFGTQALVDFLKSEVPMEDLVSRVQSRKKAKTQLASILKPYKSVGCSTRSLPVQKKEMPPRVQKKVFQLKQVLTETSPEAPAAFDVEPLGFKILSPQ